MAKAKAEITIYHNIDITAVYRYYLLQSSTSAAPSKPTAYPPAETWSLAEPGYAEGSTNSLYTVECTLFSNDTFSYSEVSLSSSYEAAKEAYNKSVAAQESADSALDTAEQNTTLITSLEAKTDGITASVTEITRIQELNSNSIDSLSADISVLTESVNTKMDSNSVNIAISSALQNGVSKVVTEKGFRLDEEGLTISTNTSEMSTTFDEDGMEIKRGEDTQLLANNKGVVAYDLHAKTYLIVGDNSRFEDYTKNGGNLLTNKEWVATSSSTGTTWGLLGDIIPVKNGETYVLSTYRNGVLLTDSTYGYAYAYRYNSDQTAINTVDYMSTASGVSTKTIDDEATAYLRIYLGPKNYQTGDKFLVKFEKKIKQTGCFWIGDTEV